MEAPQTYSGPFAFFKRHFNGDYSLGRSYWINTFLISMIAPLLGILMLPWLGENFPARYSSAGVLLITALGIVAWTWAISGTWASANKHVARGGKQGWANAAKVMIVLGAFRMLGEIGTMTGPLVMKVLGSLTPDQVQMFVSEEKRAAACAAVVAYLGALNAIPERDRARSLRVIYAAN